ncbi:MAG: TetR/AcrR family transcriptional regulator, partial [Chloroflexota bacterium]
THKMDRRIKRTRKLLGNALIELMQHKTLAEIAVREITERADVAYSTFFRNFESKEALLLDVMQQAVAGLSEEMLFSSGHSFIEQTRASILAIFEAVKANVETHRVLLQAPSAAPILKGFKQQLVAGNLRQLARMEIEPRPDIPPIELIMDNGMTQLLGLIDWWLDHELIHAPEEMAAHYELLVIRPTWSLILGEEGMKALLDG